MPTRYNRKYESSQAQKYQANNDVAGRVIIQFILGFPIKVVYGLFGAIIMCGGAAISLAAWLIFMDRTNFVSTTIQKMNSAIISQLRK